jgi:flavin reductase (DIM6/NTAB) family NADH-FMN oxidoreductase RutF
MSEQSGKRSLGVTNLVFPNPVFIVCTYDEAGRANAINLAWGGVASSGPEAVSIAVRPSRHTHAALLQRRAFTLNLPSERYVAEADYFGIVSGRDVDKFAATGLTPVRGTHVDAPLIEEFPYGLECEVTQTLDLGAHTLFIGAVRDVKASPEFLDADGVFDTEAAGILTYDVMSRQYRLPGELVAPAFNIGKKFK